MTASQPILAGQLIEAAEVWERRGGRSWAEAGAVLRLAADALSADDSRAELLRKMSGDDFRRLAMGNLQ